MYWNIFFRFANILKLSRVSVENIQKVVKTTNDLHSSSKCNIDEKTMLSDDAIMTLVKRVELQLQIESSEQINKNLTKEELQTAGEMFLYLYHCLYEYRHWISSWKLFYKYLFRTQSADQIILTLNRMMKAQDKDATVRAEKLLKRISNLMSLSLEKIHTLLSGKTSRNESFTIEEDPMIQRFGTHSSDH